MKNEMKNKKAILGTTLLAGSIIGLGGLQANAAELFQYNDLGSGSELRADLLNSERSIDNALELKCGEGKAKKAESKTTEQKCGEGKCGEGKCGEKAKKAETKKEGKAAEHKCGEGKCGEKAKKAETKKEGKAVEHKCGEGKCGEK